MPDLTSSPAAIGPLSPSASSSLAVLASGRNKAQSWCRDTPPSGKSGGGPTPLLQGRASGGYSREPSFFVSSRELSLCHRSTDCAADGGLLSIATEAWAGRGRLAEGGVPPVT
jgi:hypothetical protein